MTPEPLQTIPQFQCTAFMLFLLLTNGPVLLIT